MYRAEPHRAISMNLMPGTAPARYRHLQRRHLTNTLSTAIRHFFVQHRVLRLGLGGVRNPSTSEPRAYTVTAPHLGAAGCSIQLQRPIVRAHRSAPRGSACYGRHLPIDAASTCRPPVDLRQTLTMCVRHHFQGRSTHHTRGLTHAMSRVMSSPLSGVRTPRA